MPNSTAISRAAPREKPLDQGSLRRALRHSAKTVVYSGSQPRGLTQDWEKPPQPCASTVKDRHRKANLSASQWVFRSGIPMPHCGDADFSADHRFSTSPQQRGEKLLQCPPMALRQTKYRQPVKYQEEDVHGVHLHPDF